MKRSFAALTPQEALHAAIFIEQRNAEIYHHLAEMFAEFGDSEALEISAVFWDMAIEERRHNSLLRAGYADRYGDSTCTLTEEDLIEFIEVPRIESRDILTGDSADNLAARDRALHVALQAEMNAQRFYSKLIEETSEAALRRLYSELAQMEDGHVAYLEGKLSREFVDGERVN